MRILAAATAVFLAGTAPALVEHCPKDVMAGMKHRLSSDGTAVAYRPDPAQIAVGKPFAIEVVACVDGDKAAAPSRIRVDAGMPMHGHGMNYAIPSGKFSGTSVRLESFLFHMPGDWQFQFALRHRGTTYRGTADYHLGL